MKDELPDFDEVAAAAQRLRGFAFATPLVESPRLNAQVGGRVLIKAECLQRTGSFKFRGAWNCISQIDETKAASGVVAYSSGNHAQGVAAAAALRGFPATIVMPADTPEIKKSNTLSHGARIVTYDRVRESREDIAAAIARDTGAILVPPFEHPHIIAGQGTVGLELATQADRSGARLDDVLVGCSGGGLTAGIALSLERLSPECRVHTVEPADFDDYRRSLLTGRREQNAKASGSICDALLSPSPGEMTFAINRPRLAEGLVVSDSEALAAMKFAFEHLKLVLEPGGAAALAAVLSGHFDCKGKTVGVIASGGNVDARQFCEAIAN